MVDIVILLQLYYCLPGLKEVESECRKLNIPFHLLLGPSKQVLPPFIKENEVTALVTDFSPLREPQMWVTDLCQQLPPNFPVAQVGPLSVQSREFFFCRFNAIVSQLWFWVMFLKLWLKVMHIDQRQNMNWPLAANLKATNMMFSSKKLASNVQSSCIDNSKWPTSELWHYCIKATLYFIYVFIPWHIIRPCTK